MKRIINKLIRLKFLNKNIRLHSSVLLNNLSQLEGKNIIGKGSNICTTIIGRMSYVGNDCQLDNCFIGRYCSISDRVRVISGVHPISECFSTHPAFYSADYIYTYTKKQKFIEQKYFDINKKIKIRIGNDVWIGSDVCILSGVNIGDGAIIGAGAIVTQNVLPYSIVVGVPAKVLRMRFSKDIIEKLLSLKWWTWDEERLRKYEEKFWSKDICFFENYI